MAKYWTTDIDTYTKLQNLKKFVAFVAGMKHASDKDRQTALQIEQLITTIDRPETFKTWNVCLDIFDRDIHYGRKKQQGVYWRKWAIWFEKDYLEIEARTEHTDEPLYHYGNDFYYNAYIAFALGLPGERIYFTEDITAFISDALQYEIYVRDGLNDIKVDIEIES